MAAECPSSDVQFEELYGLHKEAIYRYLDKRQFQVYQIQGNSGRMIGEVTLESGALGSFKNIGAMVLHQDFLYAIANVKNGQEDGWRLVRIPWVAAK